MTATLLDVMCPDQVVETKSDQGRNLGGEEERGSDQPRACFRVMIGLNSIVLLERAI